MPDHQYCDAHEGQELIVGVLSLLPDRYADAVLGVADTVEEVQAETSDPDVEALANLQMLHAVLSACFILLADLHQPAVGPPVAQA